MRNCIRLALIFLSCAAFALGPPSFVPNLGQWEGEFAFRCQAGGGTYFVTSSGMVMKFTVRDEG